MDPGGGGGPAPFLIKTYDMVDDPATDAVVSWSEPPESASFVVWNPPEFAARLLPTYFKHNNFSSFIRQLNTYGFRKIHPERWEFGNEFFVKGQKHLLKNIHRRKPIHSHSHPVGSLPDAERLQLEEEIERLTREKAALQAELSRFKEQHSGAILQIEDLERRVIDMEQRQMKMLAFLERASQNPQFLENLVRMAEGSAIFTDSIHKKRRLPAIGFTNEATEMSFDDHSTTSRLEAANLLDHDFCDKLKLGLCPSMIETPPLTTSNQSSNEDSGGLIGHSECGRMRTEYLTIVPETLELCDTGTSICSLKNSPAADAAAASEGSLLPYQLDLTLASSADVDPAQIPNTASAEVGIDRAAKEVVSLGRAVPEPPAAPPPVRANDKFWEQFLTERPGDGAEAEEASSNLRADAASWEQMEGGNSKEEEMVRNKEDMEQLKLL